eukprot:c8286_g1_i1.p1 GENE.c8286_g1_i1~~c8286_g1_i1.p1  ORF type:complete len:416 (+),score=105.12 c8286_g1_i1:285-1532(+)
MGAEESTLNCCARTRGGANSASSDRDNFLVFSDDQSRPSAAFEPVEHVVMSQSLKEGYLIKTAPGKAKKPRYLRLKNDLYYFGTKEDITPKGVVLLCRQGKLPVAVQSSELGDPHEIKITHVAVTFFRASSREESEKWLSALQTVIDPLQNGDGKPDDKEVQDNDVVVFQGSLQKRSFGSEWKTYWFVLRQSGLAYFAHMQDQHPKGVISLSRQLMQPHVMCPHHNPLVLRLRHAKTTVLTAEAAPDLDDWLKSIDASSSNNTADDDKLASKKNQIGWKRTGKLREVVTPLIDLLRDPFRVEFFRQFIKEMGCDHYLLFWLDVQQFKRLCKKEDKYYLKPCAVVIFTKYIRSEGPMQVDLPQDIKDKTLVLLDDPSMNTFRDSQLYTFQVLRDEFYPLFLTSNHCVMMAEALFAQ